MQNIKFIIEEQAKKAVLELYGIEEKAGIPIQKTRKEFEGDFTLVVFPFTKTARKKPDDIAQEIGENIKANMPEVVSFNVVKGFLNIKLTDAFWVKRIKNLQEGMENRIEKTAQPYNIMVEYSSPNTNKPLHLGHIRNNLLGFSMAEIFKARGHKVTKANLVNDRGIHICKSMLAYSLDCTNKKIVIDPENFFDLYPNLRTEKASTIIKGDKLVGYYYVEFESLLRNEFTERLKNQRKINSFTSPIYQKLKERTIHVYGIDDIGKTPNEWTISGVLASYVQSHIAQFNPRENENYGLIFGLTASSIEGNLEEFNKHGLSIAISATQLTILWTRLIKITKTLTQNIKKEREERNSEFFKDIRENSDLFDNVREMLRKWEGGDPIVLALWNKMNAWVYSGFEQTYTALGVDFDKYYYESNTYLLGKNIIEEGLKRGVFYKKEDASVWCDLTEDGLDEKLVLRSDGTSVYMTQDIGTAELKYADFKIDRSIYVVGDEQDYHFKVLKTILLKMGRPYAKGIDHLSYGMIDLPTGRMKSREGTVVDADDLIAEMRDVAKKQTETLGKTEGLSNESLNDLYDILGLGALKYYLLKVDPKKRMTFNPEESIDFQGNTGPFVQYNYTRIKSVERKWGSPLSSVKIDDIAINLSNAERELCIMLTSFNEVLLEAEQHYSPAVLANYVYNIAKTFSSYYAESSVIREKNDHLRKFRLALLNQILETLQLACSLLGMKLPERM